MGMPGSIVPLKPAIGTKGTTLFCFTWYMQDTGSTKKFYDLSLLRTSLFLGASIFGCEAYKVYSDVETWLSPGQVNTVKVDDVNGDFHFAKRKLTGTWVNSPIFIQIWKAIRTEGLWANHDWTVKVDADSVFLPMRLRTKLSSQKVTSSGIYLENCKYVNFGFFGNLEVISHQGFSAFLANLEDCTKALNWKGKEKDTGMGGGSLHAEVHGLARSRQGRSVGPHNRLDVQGFQARRPEEEREVETELRIDADSSNASVHETL